VTDKRNGLLIGRLGIPGSGKSWFVRSAAAVGKTWVAVTDPQELHGYEASERIETRLFYDDAWHPAIDLWSGNAWGGLLKELYALKERKDVAIVAIDSMTGASELASHDIRKLTKSVTLKEVGEYGLGYVRYSAHLGQLLAILKVLALNGKHVICTFHIAEREQEGAGSGRMVNGELEFEDRLLPVLERSREVQSIAGHFALWLYSSVVGTQYRVQSLPDQANPAKSRLVFDPKLSVNGRVDNDLAKVLAAIKWTA